MAEERRPPRHNGEERRRGERRSQRASERRDDEEAAATRPDLGDPGFQSKRSELHEGWYDRDRHAERGGEWGWRDQDRAEEYGSMHREVGAPPRRPWRAEDYPEYGGEGPRRPPPSRWAALHGRAYPRGDFAFEHRERPGYQADPYESGLTLRHPEHVTRAHLDEGIPARERGGFAGRGPRGYRRSDERIWEDVCEHLTHAASVDASEIEVRLERGEVTLEGTVHSRYEKRAAEDIAAAVGGVVDVYNRLRLAHLEG